MSSSFTEPRPPPGYVRLCALDDLEEEEIERVEVDGHPPIAVYLLDGECYATADTCSHGNASLAHGFVEDGEVECPFHGGRFDIRSGAATAHPCTADIAVYPVVATDTEVFAKLNVAKEPDGGT